MNDIRRTILWVIFGFSMVLLWDQWQVHNGKQATFFPSATGKPPVAVGPSTTPVTGSVPAPVVPAAAIPAGQTTAAVASVIPAPLSALPREQVVVTTDVLKLTFDSEGGSLIRTEFLKYADTTDR